MSTQTKERNGHVYQAYLIDLDGQKLDGGQNLDRRLLDILKIIREFGIGKIGADETLVCFDEALAIFDHSLEQWEESHAHAQYLELCMFFTTNVVDDFFIDEDEKDLEWFGQRYQELAKIEGEFYDGKIAKSTGWNEWDHFLKVIQEIMLLIQKDKQSEIAYGMERIPSLTGEQK